MQITTKEVHKNGRVDVITPEQEIDCWTVGHATEVIFQLLDTIAVLKKFIDDKEALKTKTK